MSKPPPVTVPSKPKRGPDLDALPSVGSSTSCPLTVLANVRLALSSVLSSCAIVGSDLLNSCRNKPASPELPAQRLRHRGTKELQRGPHEKACARGGARP